MLATLERPRTQVESRPLHEVLSRGRGSWTFFVATSVHPSNNRMYDAKVQNDSMFNPLRAELAWSICSKPQIHVFTNSRREMNVLKEGLLRGRENMFEDHSDDLRHIRLVAGCHQAEAEIEALIATLHGDSQ